MTHRQTLHHNIYINKLVDCPKEHKREICLWLMGVVFIIIIYCQRREVVVVNVCLVALGQIGVGGKLQGKQAMRRS